MAYAIACGEQLSGVSCLSPARLSHKQTHACAVFEFDPTFESHCRQLDAQQPTLDWLLNPNLTEHEVYKVR